MVDSRDVFVREDGKLTLVIGASDHNADWIGNSRGGAVRKEELAIHAKLSNELVLGNVEGRPDESV